MHIDLLNGARVPVLTADMTVGQMVAANPAYSRVFEQFGIDYCCGGKRTLAAACEKRGIVPDSVLAALQACEQPGPDEPDLTTATLTQLADHIEERHHAMLRSELPRLAGLLRKVVAAHGEAHPELLKLAEVYTQFAAELGAHMNKEEQVLFPALRRLEEGGAAWPGLIEGPIACMIAEHDDAGQAMEIMRHLTGGYVPPAGACGTYRALYEGLLAIESDMHRHVHKENNILFPMAARRLAEHQASAAGRPTTGSSRPLPANAG